MAKYAKTIDAVAEHFGVSRQTVTEWKRRPGFPEQTKRGLYSLVRIEKWTRENGVGRHKGAAAGTGPDGQTLADYNKQLRKEQAENERIKKERQLVEQAKELAQIVDVEDVRSDVSQMIATVVECASGLHTAIDRALPESTPAEDAWEEIRSKVLSLVEKLPADMSSAVNELW